MSLLNKVPFLAVLGLLLALAPYLASSAPAPVTSPANKAVGSLKCSLAASGTLKLVPARAGSNSTALGLSNAGTSDVRLLNRFNNKEAHASVEFLQCSDSSFLGYKSTDKKKYGHIQVKANGECLVGQDGDNASSTFLTHPGRRCSLSDDSGQLFQTWSFERGAHGSPVIKYVRHRKGDSFAGNQFSYSFTPHGSVIGQQRGNDGSHLSF